MIDELPNACALISMAACCQLARHGISCRPIRIKYQKKPKRGHIVTVIEFGGRIHIYGSDGTCTLPKIITENSSPVAIAKEYKRIGEFDPPILGAEWY